MRLFGLIQIIVSALLMTVILLQSKGTGLGRAWGGEGGFYHTKRGVEKVLFIATMILALVFFISSILNFALY